MVGRTQPPESRTDRASRLRWVRSNNWYSTMASALLNASVREDRGTGVARKLRRAGQVPAVIYGHGREPQSLTIDTREIEKLLSQFSAASTVIDLSIAGGTARTLIREIQ